MTNEEKIVAFEKATGRKFDPNVTVFRLNNVSGISKLPALPNVTNFVLNNVSGISELPALPNVTDFVLNNVSGISELPALPNVTYFGLNNVSGISKLPALPNVVYFGLDNVSGISELPALPNVTYFRLENVSGANVVANCGNNSRCLAAIYGKGGKPYIFIGCFSGDESAAIAAINEKYSGAEAYEYVEKIKKTFSLLKK